MGEKRRSKKTDLEIIEVFPDGPAPSLEEINAAILDSLARDLALAVRQRRAAEREKRGDNVQKE